MSFERLWCLALLLPALILVILSNRPRRQRLTTLILLQPLLASGKTRRGVRIEQILLPAALMLGIVALSGPRWPQPEGELIVVIDQRVSLNTRSGGASAEQRGLRLIAERFGDIASVVRESDALTTAQARAAAGARVIVLDDRLSREIPVGIGRVQVGDAEHNSGLSCLALDPDGVLRVGVVCRGGSVARRLSVREFRADGGSRTLLEIPVPDGGVQQILSDVKPDNGERIVAELTPPDALVEDDRAELVGRPSPLSIGFPAEGETALVRAFAAQHSVKILRGAGACDLRVGAGDARHHLHWRVEGAEQERSGALAGTAAQSCAGEAVKLALAKAPAGSETLISVDDTPLLVRTGADFLLLTDPLALADTAALPLLCRDLLRCINAEAAWHAIGVLDAEVSAGPRASSDSVVSAPAAGHAHTALDTALLVIVAALGMLWLILQMRSRP